MISTETIDGLQFILNSLLAIGFALAAVFVVNTIAGRFMEPDWSKEVTDDVAKTKD